MRILQRRFMRVAAAVAVISWGAALFAAGLLLGTGSAAAVTIFDCTLSMDSLFKTGEVASGTASDLGGVVLGAWTHDAPGFSFETAGDPDDVICSQNGLESADIVGLGSALVNGVPGHSYLIEIEDNGGPTTVDQIRLCASLVQSPRTSNKGKSSFDPPRTAVIPAVIPVTLGSAGAGLARLQLDKVKCKYRGDGTDYLFERCVGPGGHELMPGDTIPVSEVSLRVQTADRGLPVTSVLVDFGTDPSAPPGTADFYLILVSDPDGALIYSFSAAVPCGDVVINPIP